MCQGNVHGSLQGFSTQAQSQMWFVFLVEFQQINLNWINSSVGLNRSCKKSELHFDQSWIWKHNDTPRVHQYCDLLPGQFLSESRIILGKSRIFSESESGGGRDTKTPGPGKLILSLWEERKSVCLESVGQRYPRVTWIGLCLACILNPNSV